MPSSDSDGSNLPHVSVVPVTGWALPDIGEVIRYRDLLWILTTRQLSLIYRQSILGVGWAVLRPLVTTCVFWLVFGRIAGLEQSQTVEYPLFILSGLVLWNLFASSLSHTSESVVAQGHILTKIFFPRLILPLSALGVAVVDFIIQFAILGCIMIYYTRLPPPQIILCPLFAFATVVTAFSAGIWLTAINVRFSRHKAHCPFFHSNLVLPNASHLLIFRDPREMALVRPIQSHVHRDRGFPLVAYRHTAAKLDMVRSVTVDHIYIADPWRHLLSSHRGHFC